jgi:hypothetical protein
MKNETQTHPLFVWRALLLPIGIDYARTWGGTSTGWIWSRCLRIFGVRIAVWGAVCK